MSADAIGLAILGSLVGGFLLLLVVIEVSLTVDEARHHVRRSWYENNHLGPMFHVYNFAHDRARKKRIQATAYKERALRELRGVV